MADIPVFYVDGFEMHLSPFGALLRFGARLPAPAQGQPAPAAVFSEAARVGMSFVHLKVMATILVREILRHEGVLKQQVDLSDEVLQSVALPLAEWRQFWNLPAPPVPVPSVSPGAAALAPK